MKIFVIGQCTLHWGRMEYGNIGNYYVIEPFFRELHRVFPDAVITTTFQMSSGFQKREKVSCVPMNYYYSWTETDLGEAYQEYTIASIYNETGTLIGRTGFIDEVLQSDLVIDFSGDIWGKNANLVGPNRFLIGLLKDRVVQLLKKPIAMLAGSPGPFDENELLPLAKLVFSNFNLVTNREPVSRIVLKDFGFDVSGRVYDLACPAFLFEPASKEKLASVLKGTVLENKQKPVIGFVLCGWNLLKGPFSRTDWDDCEFDYYVDLLTHMVQDYDVDVCLMSHSNGFILPPHFQLIHGRDYPIVQKIYDLLKKSSISNSIFMLDGIYSPAETKGIISQFDMLITGRVHAAVAALSQAVPTTIIDYGHEPKAHKLRGFAQVAGVEQYVADPSSRKDLFQKVDACWNRRQDIHDFLVDRNKQIAEDVKKNFDLLRTLTIC